MSVIKKTVLSTALLAVSGLAAAGTDVFFNPLTQSSAVATPNHVNELNSPWQTPAGISQVKLMSLADIEADTNQSVIRVPGLGRGASMFDMIAFDNEGENIFIPHETYSGAGVSRYNIATNTNKVLFSGDSKGPDGDWSNDFGAFDPARFTPNGTIMLGEEWSGEGRVIEVLNPYAAPENIKKRELHGIPNVSHEGIMFSKKNDAVMYFVDENNSGSIYKIIYKDPSDYSKGGQVFVLSVKAFRGDAEKNWNDEVNANQPRTGKAKWVRMTNKKGKPLTSIDPFMNDGSRRAGREAADELRATPYGRPEDAEVGTLASGNEVLYFTATSEKAVYSVEMKGRKKAVVRMFANEADTPKNQGYPATTGVINSPDNLAQDALGNIYIIEDAPNGGDVGGDIWFAKDTDNDGVAESVYHFMSIQVDGAEATGMIFNPANPTQFVVAVQHPDSTDIEAVENGQGDALWMFDLKNTVPPVCQKAKNRHWWNAWLKPTCTNAEDYYFPELLEEAGIWGNDDWEEEDQGWDWGWNGWGRF